MLNFNSRLELTNRSKKREISEEMLARSVGIKTSQLKRWWADVENPVEDADFESIEAKIIEWTNPIRSSNSDLLQIHETVKHSVFNPKRVRLIKTDAKKPLENLQSSRGYSEVASLERNLDRKTHRAVQKNPFHDIAASVEYYPSPGNCHN